jgi:serine/threonine-protein kinase ATR
MKQYGEALSLSQKHVFQALPRFLTLWFDFTSIDTNDQISANQEAAISIAYDYLKKIPAISYYSVLPQLISRIGHSDDDTAVMVVAILKRVLTKFPAQAMWHLAWLRQSVHKDRQKKGDEIFKSAQKNLHRNEKMKMHDLLEASKELFKFLIDLAKYQPKRADQNLFNVHQWQGKVDLKEFMPPVQAALTVSRNAVGIAGSSEAFPKCVPRMRAFSTQVTMMSSKARPKKLTAFAIPEGSKTPESTSRNTSRPMSGDIGEMHFLVKREARGDLRKDARVQDLNTVINRLLSSSSCVKNTGKRQHRRLHLRTFAVTCLSEDCGILEW